MCASEIYRRFARACLEFADATEDEQTRAALIQMAQVWFRLAVEHENDEDTESAD
jgi:hypothetical protein